jgi:aminoglycoside phosphotransferase (APT) family kinase protein
LYSPQNNEHRALAARWLAAVHNAGQHLGWETRLPDRGPRYYLQLLQSCRAKVREHFTNAHLPSGGAAVLQTVAEQCDVLEAHWNELEEICYGMPRTLVHGDFVNKNVRVRRSAQGPELLVFDWEFAGWGVPSTDLAQETGRTISPDLGVYRSCLDGWRMMEDGGRIQRLAEYGRFFRLVDTMWWESLGLTFGRADCLIEPIVCLKIYAERMTRAFSAAGWRPYD